MSFTKFLWTSSKLKLSIIHSTITLRSTLEIRIDSSLFQIYQNKRQNGTNVFFKSLYQIICFLGAVRYFIVIWYWHDLISNHSLGWIMHSGYQGTQSLKGKFIKFFDHHRVDSVEPVFSISCLNCSYSDTRQDFYRTKNRVLGFIRIDIANKKSDDLETLQSRPNHWGLRKRLLMLAWLLDALGSCLNFIIKIASGNFFFAVLHAL